MERGTRFLIWVLFGWYLFDVLLAANIDFRNIECTAFNKSFVDFNDCFIKAVNRSYKYFTIRTKILNFPITSIKVRGAILKLSNGYQPFMYNTSADGCKFLRSKNRGIIHNFFYSLFAGYSNLNHSCPYNEDMFVEKVDTVSIAHKLTHGIPFPVGDYCVHTTWTLNGMDVARIVVYGHLF